MLQKLWNSLTGDPRPRKKAATAENYDSTPLGFLRRHFEEVKEHWKISFAFSDYYYLKDFGGARNLFPSGSMLMSRSYRLRSDQWSAGIHFSPSIFFSLLEVRRFCCSLYMPIILLLFGGEF